MAKKKLRQILEEQSERTLADIRVRNHATFLAWKDEIADALEGGWSIMKIWTGLRKEGEIDFSYQVFARYIRREIREVKVKERKKEEVKVEKVEPVVLRKGVNISTGCAMSDLPVDPNNPNRRLPRPFPKPDSGPPKPVQLGPQGQMPVYGKKPKLDDFDKF